MIMNLNMFVMLMTMMSVIVLIYSNNPMKSSFLILVLSSLMFFYLKTNSGMTWMPMIFFILFTGGILMVFMILSSVLPNEKTLKIKIPKSMLAMTSILILMEMKFKSLEKSNLAPEMKSFISSSSTLMFMMSVILLYFFSSININSSEDLSMRSLLCWKQMIL